MFGTWWTNILESLFQDGMPHALLGSEDYLEGYTENLLWLIEHTSQLQDLAVSQSEAELASGFLQGWRSSLIRAMERRAVWRSTDGPLRPANVEGQTTASVIPFSGLRRQKRPQS
jgi:hypothetical protein